MPGDIIQMRVKNQSTGATYPHTAIAESNYNGTMYRSIKSNSLLLYSGGASAPLLIFMKKNIQIIFLISYLSLAAFLLGFTVFQNPRISNGVQIYSPTSCPPDARVATSKWLTFTTNEYPKFSVDYPEVLIPNTQSRFINVFFRAKTNPYSNAPLGIDITVFSADTWKSNDRVSGIKTYQCVGGPMSVAHIFSGSKVYLISAIGISLPDVERIINSIKPID